MQYLLQILQLSCQIQRLPGYQASWSVLLRNRMAERFASVSEDELCRLIEEKDSKNTKRAKKASLKVFNEYLQEKNLDEPHHDDKVTLANVLKRFHPEARKKSDGSRYSKSSMTSLRFGLNRHFKTKGTDIIQDPVFAEANKVFLAKCVDLKRQGLAKVEHKPAILGPVHTKTIVNANASKRKLFYAFRPSVHTKTMKTLTVNA